MSCSCRKWFKENRLGRVFSFIYFSERENHWPHVHLLLWAGLFLPPFPTSSSPPRSQSSCISRIYQVGRNAELALLSSSFYKTWKLYASRLLLSPLSLKTETLGGHFPGKTADGRLKSTTVTAKSPQMERTLGSGVSAVPLTPCWNRGCWENFKPADLRLSK